jgi:HEAT repeat protein
MDDLVGYLAELTGGDDRRAEAAVQKIAAIGSEAVPALIVLLASPVADARWWATWALAEIRDARVSPLLIRALHDPESSVRQAAALALRVQPNPEAVLDLIAILHSAGSVRPGEGDPTLAHLAAAALIAVGTAAVPALIHSLENGPQSARHFAARCLAQIGDKRAVPALLAALESGSGLLEHWASEGLKRMGVGMAFMKPE